MEFSTLEELLVKLVCSVEFPVNQSNSETGDQLNVGSIKLTGLDHRLGGGSDQLKAEMLLENGEIKRLFLKIKKKGSWLEDFEKTFHIFEKEMFMYQNLLPEMSRFQLHHSGKHSVANLFPKFYGSGYVKEDLYLVFEDILTDNTNFRVTNKIEFHTIPQIELALTKLGVFHAVGYAMKFSGIKFSEKYPELKEQLWNPVNREQGIFRTEQREWLDGLLLLITSVLEENAKGNPVLAKTGFKTSLSADKMDAVRKYSRNCAEITELAMLPVEPLAVLTHGDFHMWNMAFHTNMREIKLFDLQVARYSSPAVDIIQYLSQVSTAAERLEHLETFLTVYLESLKKTLQDLGYQISSEFTQENLAAEYRRVAGFGFLLSTRWLPGRYIDNLDQCIKLVQKREKENSSEAEDIISLLNESGDQGWWILQVLCENIQEAFQLGTIAHYPH